MSESPVVLITGASRGIGRAIAEHLAEKNYRLALGARSLDTLQVLKDEYAWSNDDVTVTHLDVTVEESVRRFIDEAHQHFGQVDILINNAGLEISESVENADLERSRELLDVLVIGVLSCCKHAIAHMKARGGHIINVGSEASFRSMPTKGVYSAGKFAARALSEALRLEVEPYKIDVSQIHPGYVDTGLHDQAKQIMAEKGYAAPKARYTPKDIAIAVERLIHRPQLNYIPSVRGKIQVLLAHVAPAWVDRRIRKVLRRNNYEFY